MLNQMKFFKQLIQKNKIYGVYRNNKKKILLKSGKVTTMNQKYLIKILLNLMLLILQEIIRKKLIKQFKLKHKIQFNKIKI